MDYLNAAPEGAPIADMKTESQHKAPAASRNRITNAHYDLWHGDARRVLKQIPSESVDLIVTDPPYFIDGMGDDWSRSDLTKRASKAKLVGGLPTGMRFDPKQGPAFQKFMEPICEQAFRILRPGGFMISFSQARLYGRLAVAVEDAGFELRDMMAWKYDGQAKAFSQDHFLRKQVKSGKLTQEQADAIAQDIGGRKTPQLRPQMEPMTLAQKPKTGTFIENWMAHRTGLVDVSQTLDGFFPGNVMEVAKPRKAEKGEGNEHLTVKPVALIEHLVRLFSVPGQTVLDMFCGSGSHGVAAIRAGRHFIGIERERVYFKISRDRMDDCIEHLSGDSP